MACPSTDARVLQSLESGVASPVTLATYAARLHRLKRKLRAASFCDIARQATKHIAAIRRTASGSSPLTTKNLVSAVSAVFKHDAGMRHAFPRERDKWAEYHTELKAAEVKAYHKNLPLNERQAKNYVSMDEIEARFVERMKAGHASGLKDSMQTLLLGFYSDMLPKRSDLGALHAYRSAKELATVPAQELRQQNYVVLFSSPSSSAPSSRPLPAAAAGRLVLHKHKTSKTYAEIVEEVPKRLAKQIAASLDAWPRSHVFVDTRGRPLTNNGYTQFVIRSFKEMFGRGAGTALLRHAYVTERVDFNNMSTEQRQHIARLMGHTTDVQDTVYRWVGDWRDHPTQKAPAKKASAKKAPAKKAPASGNMKPPAKPILGRPA
jgi:hypothetical protein